MSACNGHLFPAPTQTQGPRAVQNPLEHPTGSSTHWVHQVLGREHICVAHIQARVHAHTHTPLRQERLGVLRAPALPTWALSAGTAQGGSLRTGIGWEKLIRAEISEPSAHSQNHSEGCNSHSDPRGGLTEGCG